MSGGGGAGEGWILAEPSIALGGGADDSRVCGSNAGGYFEGWPTIT